MDCGIKRDREKIGKPENNRNLNLLNLNVSRGQIHLTKFSFVHHWTIWSHLYLSICQVPNLILSTLGGNKQLFKSCYASFLDNLVGVCVRVRTYKCVCRRMNKK